MLKRNFNIDIIKLFAIISVIIIHSISMELQNRYLGAYTIAQAVPLFIIVYGFNFYNSTVTKQLTVRAHYQPARLWEKCRLIILPFVVIYLLEVLLLGLTEQMTPKTVWLGLLNGDYGPGSYYVVWLLTLVLVTPLLYQAVCRAPELTLALILVISFSGEFFMAYYQVPNAIYRLSPLRFLLPLVLGLYYGLKRPRVNGRWLLLGLLSMVYILLVEYVGMPSLAHPDWGSQNTLSFFYPFLLFMWVEPFEFSLSTRSKRWVTAISRTTYHIFLVQMLYFGTEISDWFEDSLPGNAEMPALYILVSLLICVTLGILFYRTETRVYQLAAD